MAALLIGLKLTELRHSLRGGQATYLWLGAFVGGIAALWTANLGLSIDATNAWDMLATAYGAWLLAWVLISLTGADPLRPEQFALMPISAGRLARGLLIAAAVGVLPAVTLVAEMGVIVAAAPGGPAAVLAAVVAAALSLALLIAISKVVLLLTGRAMSTRVGLELAGFQRGLLIALIWIWIPIAAISASPGGSGLSFAAIGDVAEFLPSGWAVVATSAAVRGDWLLAIAVIALMAIALAALVRMWGALITQRLTSASVADTPRRASWVRIIDGLWPSSVFGAAARREAASWSRDPRRRVEIRSALWASGILTLLPGLFGTTILWPFAGLAIVVLASTTTANVYGMDGTSIWTTLMAPAAARSDVRARQLNWIAIFGLLGIVATLVATALSDQAWAWPWVLAALPAITGAAAGLIVLVGIVAPAPLPERRGGDPLDLGDDPRTTNAYFLQGVLLTFLSPLAAIPPLLVVAATAQTGGLVVWLGIPVGLATGVLAAWALGTVAASRLSRRGPEVLERLRARPAPVSRQRPHDRKRLPVSAWIAILIGCLALFPQSLVPALIILSGSDTRLWFLAMYLPPDLRAVGVAIMAAVGVAAFAAAWWIAMRARRAIG